jgi:hypothetical protein
MPDRHRDSLLKLVLNDVVGDGCFALDDLAVRRFSAPHIDLPLDVLGVGTDEHFEFHVFALPALGDAAAARDAADVTRRFFAERIRR